ncbi:MAG TPA: hypothetical protein VFH04_01170, partial [Nitrososphaeraceae archaeon]|nr:hypothetical protein [Nitrososphaeraceae archaeon]
IQNQLMKEALYGCTICGCPILGFVDFTSTGTQGGDVPKQEAYLSENMVAICPSHGLRFQAGEIDAATLRHSKSEPFNKVHEESAFAITSNEMTVLLGGCTFINTSRLLVVDDFDIINVRREGQKFLVLDVNFFDRSNKLVAIISQNGWSSERSRQGDWAIKYSPKSLTIQNELEKVIFDARIENKNELRILADGLYYNAQKIKITPSEVLLDDKEIGADLKGTVLTNYDVGIRADSLAF